MNHYSQNSLIANAGQNRPDEAEPRPKRPIKNRKYQGENVQKKLETTKNAAPKVNDDLRPNLFE